MLHFASELREGDERDIAMDPAHQPFHPPAKRRVALGHIGQRGARSMDQLFAQILVAAFADSEQLRLAAAISPRGSAWFPVSSPPQRSVDRVPPIARERPHALFRQ